MITDMGVKCSFNYNIPIPLDTDVYQNEKPSYYIKVRVRMHIFYKLRLLWILISIGTSSENKVSKYFLREMIDM